MNKNMLYFLSIFAALPVTNARALMRGRAAVVYHGSSVDKIRRTVEVLTTRYFPAAK